MAARVCAQLANSPARSALCEQFYTILHDNNDYYYKMQIPRAGSGEMLRARAAFHEPEERIASPRKSTSGNVHYAHYGHRRVRTDLFRKARNPRKNSIGDFLPRFDNGIFLARNFKRAVAARI
jgi:hypothetical protein